MSFVKKKQHNLLVYQEKFNTCAKLSKPHSLIQNCGLRCCDNDEKFLIVYLSRFTSIEETTKIYCPGQLALLFM